MSGVGERVHVCVRGAFLGLGEQGKREKSSKQAEVFGPFKVMRSVSEDRPLPPSSGLFLGGGGRSVHQVLTAPLRKVWTASGWAEIWKATVQSGAGASESDRSHPRGIAGAPRPEVVGGRATSLEPDPDPLGPHRVSGAARY